MWFEATLGLKINLYKSKLIPNGGGVTGCGEVGLQGGRAYVYLFRFAFGCSIQI